MLRCEVTLSMGISPNPAPLVLSKEGWRVNPDFLASLRASRALVRTVVESTAVATSFVLSCDIDGIVCSEVVLIK